MGDAEMQGAAVGESAVFDRSKVMMLLGSLLVAAIVGHFVLAWNRKRRNLPPVVDSAVPFVGGLLKFIKGPVPLLKEEYGRLGQVFTLQMLTRNVTFLIGPEVSAHFFKAQEADLSQREV